MRYSVKTSKVVNHAGPLPHDPYICSISENWPWCCPTCLALFPPPPEEISARRERRRQLHLKRKRRAAKLLTALADCLRLAPAELRQLLAAALERGAP
jgi:hypothetical protein